jgi:hypothetical protein
MGRLLPQSGRRVVVRYGTPFRVTEALEASGQPTRGRQATEAATHLIMARIAALLPPRQRGVYGEATRASNAGSSPREEAGAGVTA